MKQTSSTNSGQCSYDMNVKNGGYADGNFRWKPICGCGDMALLRRSSTVTNYGKQFWGCRNYKGSTQTGCGYFQWFYDDVVDEKDQFIKKQSIRLEKIQNELDAAKLELVSLAAKNNGLKQKTRELQIQMKKLMDAEKIGK